MRDAANQAIISDRRIAVVRTEGAQGAVHHTTTTAATTTSQGCAMPSTCVCVCCGGGAAAACVRDTRAKEGKAVCVAAAAVAVVVVCVCTCRGVGVGVTCGVGSEATEWRHEARDGVQEGTSVVDESSEPLDERREAVGVVVKVEAAVGLEARIHLHVVYARGHRVLVDPGQHPIVLIFICCVPQHPPDLLINLPACGRCTQVWM